MSNNICSAVRADFEDSADFPGIHVFLDGAFIETSNSQEILFPGESDTYCTQVAPTTGYEGADQNPLFGKGFYNHLKDAGLTEGEIFPPRLTEPIFILGYH